MAKFSLSRLARRCAESTAAGRQVDAAYDRLIGRRVYFDPLRLSGLVEWVSVRDVSDGMT